MDLEIELQGRRISATELGWLSDWIEEHPQWSRKRLARELCQRWQWVDGQGRLKDFAARSLLLKLDVKGSEGVGPRIVTYSDEVTTNVHPRSAQYVRACKRQIPISSSLNSFTRGKEPNPKSDS